MTLKEPSLHLISLTDGQSAYLLVNEKLVASTWSIDARDLTNLAEHLAVVLQLKLERHTDPCSARAVTVADLVSRYCKGAVQPQDSVPFALDSFQAAEARSEGWCLFAGFAAFTAAGTRHYAITRTAGSSLASDNEACRMVVRSATRPGSAAEAALRILACRAPHVHERVIQNALTNTGGK